MKRRTTWFDLNSRISDSLWSVHFWARPATFGAWPRLAVDRPASFGERVGHGLRRQVTRGTHTPAAALAVTEQQLNSALTEVATPMVRQRPPAADERNRGGRSGMQAPVVAADLLAMTRVGV